MNVWPLKILCYNNHLLDHKSTTGMVEILLMLSEISELPDALMAPPNILASLLSYISQRMSTNYHIGFFIQH